MFGIFYIFFCMFFFLLVIFVCVKTISVAYSHVLFFYLDKYDKKAKHPNTLKSPNAEYHKLNSELLNKSNPAPFSVKEVIYIIDRVYRK